MKKVRSSMTYANVMATIAVFLALGGGAYAAVQLPRNAVKNRNIAPNAVTSGKVKNGSLRARDFNARDLPVGPRGPQGERGIQGPQGPKGDTGPAGVSGYQIVTASSPIDNADSKAVNASCPEGKKALGGGAFSVGTQANDVKQEGPTSVLGLGEGWRAIADEEPIRTTGTWGLMVMAVCAKVD